MKYKYKIGDELKTQKGDIVKVESLQISTVDNKSFPSYWCKYGLDVFHDGCARNIWEENLFPIKSEHTKEEWIIEKRKHGFYICAGYKGFVIADVTGDEISHFVNNILEAEANTKLIAAAPEMLEVLKSANKYFINLQNKCALTNSDERAWKLISKVIKKATE